jgi:TonB family protein
MSEVLEFAQGARPSDERRLHARLRLRSLAYAELDHQNGGIVLDASESGISVHAVVALTDDVLPRMRLKLPDAMAWLETRARVVWTSESRKVAGLQFEDLPERARDQIREWLSKEASAMGNHVTSPAAPVAQRPRTKIPFEASVDGSGSDTLPQIANELHSRIAASPANDYDRSVESIRELIVNSPAPARIQSPKDSTAKLASPQKPADANEGPASRPPPTLTRQISVPQFLPEEPRRTASIYLILFALAVISLVSGWAVGRGKFHPLIKKFEGLLAPAGPLPAVQDEHPAAPLRVIEIVDSNNRHRTISLLHASTEKDRSVPQQPTPDRSAEATGNQGLNFQIWALSPPNRSAASREANAIERGAPPAVQGGKGPTLAPAIMEPMGPGALPKPDTMTGILKTGALIHRVEPNYPEIAKQQGVSGTVTLRATVDREGAVQAIRVISGPKMLVHSAVNAVRQWRYAPTLLDGKAIETEVEINLVFSLPNRAL